MKDLMNAIRDELRAEMTYIRPGDIFISPHADYVPSDVMFPAIGIKDGSVSRAELIGGCIESTMDVQIIPWVLMQKPEASIMGDGSRKGVLDVAVDIHEVLLGNLLGIDGMQEAFSHSEKPSEPMERGDSKLLQKKEITYRYIKQGDRP